MTSKQIAKILKDKMDKMEIDNNNSRNGDDSNDMFATNELYSNIVSNNQLWDIPVEEKITSHRKVVGPLIVFLKKIIKKLLYWLVTKPFLVQKNFNGSVTRTLNEIWNFIGGIQEQNKAIENKLKTSFEDINITQIKNREHLLSEISILKKQMDELTKETYKLKEQKEDEDAFTINYLEFENKFRGTEEDIKARQMEVYLPYLAKKINRKVLDVGCGRGELVNGLFENGFDSLGIDLNKQMVNHCQQKGYNVIYGDALEYLHGIEDNSLGAIFSLHVFEHLQPVQIMNLLERFYEKVEDGGLVILETPNPECLYTLAYGFSMDLTHKKILHPYTMKFLLEEVGFRDIEIKHLSPVAQSAKLKTLNEQDNMETINDNFKKINDLLFGYQDYAIVAKK